jgi:TIR domain
LAGGTGEWLFWPALPPRENARLSGMTTDQATGPTPQAYTYDVFISYARVNDAETGWVSEFRQQLELLLQTKITGGRARVGLDHGEIGLGTLSEELQQILSDTAILLIVLSNRWLERNWCQKELEWFIAAAGGLPQAQKTNRGGAD